MPKKYNIYIVARLYTKSFYKFLITETNVRSTNEANLLFVYSLKKMYGLDTIEYCSAINKYGGSCIECLSNVKGTPKNKEKVPYEDKVKLVSVCEVFVNVTGLLSYKAISGRRAKEG